MRNLKAYLYKFGSKVLELIGRVFLFNWFPPSVAEVIRNVRYGGESRAQSLDIIIPEGKPPFPVLIYIHGGGFHVMDRRSYRRMSRYFASRGCVVFNINYRMAPKHRFPVPLQDVALAAGWVHRYARRYGGDSSRLFLAGDSAGAYFASMYAAAVQSAELMSANAIEEGVPAEHLRGLLLFYGAYDMETVLDTGFPMINMMSKGFFGYDPQVYEARVRTASPQRHISEGYPPAFLTSGERDSLHSQSLAFERILDGAGVPHRSVFFTKKEHPLAYTWHGFASVPFFKCSRVARAEACQFIAEHS